MKSIKVTNIFDKNSRGHYREKICTNLMHFRSNARNYSIFKTGLRIFTIFISFPAAFETWAKWHFRQGGLLLIISAILRISLKSGEARFSGAGGAFASEVGKAGKPS
jgi:hypothetical protein